MYCNGSFLIHVSAGAQNFSCDASLSKPLCPGIIARCNCTLNSRLPITRWSFSGPNNTDLCEATNNNFDLVQLGGDSCNENNGICGSYLRVANQPSVDYSSPCYTSTLNITANSGINGVVAKCLDLWPSSMMIGNVTITILGKLTVQLQLILEFSTQSIRLPC